MPRHRLLQVIQFFLHDPQGFTDIIAARSPRFVTLNGIERQVGDAFGHIVDGLAALFVESPGRPVTHADN